VTTHSYHPDTHIHGLRADCPRCIEHAEHPERSLDSTNLARLRAGRILTALDARAAVNLMKYDEADA